MSTRWHRLRDVSPAPNDPLRYPMTASRPHSPDQSEERLWHADHSRVSSLHYAQSLNASAQDVTDSLHLQIPHSERFADTTRLTEPLDYQSQKITKPADLPKKFRGATNNDHKATKRGRPFYLSFTCLCLIAYQTSLDAVIVAAALPDIADDLNADSAGAFWCGTGFLIAQAIMPPLYGLLSESVGRKMSILAALSMFVTASVFCATARSITWLIIARVWQGLGAGGLNSTSNIIVTDLVGLRERGKFTGLFALASALGLVTGNLIGSSMAEYLSWRWIFWINLPLGLTPLIGLVIFLNPDRTEKSFLEAIRDLDWIGLVVLVGSSISLLYGITTGGVLHPWISAQTIVPLMLGAVGIAAFVAFEGWQAKNPLMPLRIFSRRTAAAGYISTFFHGFIVWAMSYLLILYFLGSFGHSLFLSAVETLPGAGMIAPVAAGAGFLLSATKKFQKVVWASWAFLVLGLSLMATLRANSSPAAQFGFQVITAIGSGALFPSRMLAVQADQDEDDIPMAVSFVVFIMGLGQAFGVGVGGQAFQSQWDALVEQAQRMPGRLPAQYVIPGSDAQSAAFIFNAFPQDIQILYRDINAKALSTVWIVLATCAGIAFLSSLLMKDLTLDQSRGGQAHYDGIEE